MAKSIKELKKENIFLKSKSEKSDVTLIELVEEVRFTCISPFFFFFFNLFVLLTVKISQCTTPDAFIPMLSEPWLAFI